jgi:hypothetical protein
VTDEQLSRQVSLPAAAAALGISVQAVRRRIKSGELRAERVKRPQGYAYRVTLPAGVDVPEGADVDQAEGEHLPAPTGAASNGHVRHVPGRAAPAPAGDGLAAALLTDLRAAHARIESLERERFELAGRLGYFQAELEHARQAIKALEAPKEPIAPPPPAGAIFRPLPAAPEPPRRPWWRFW